MRDLQKVNVLPEPRDRQEAAFSVGEASSAISTQQLLRGSAPSIVLKLVSQLRAAVLADHTVRLVLPLLFFQVAVEDSIILANAGVFDWLFADRAGICRAKDVCVGFDHRIYCIFLLKLVVQGIHSVKEPAKSLVIAGLSFQLQRALQADADEELQIVRQTCDK